MLLDQLMCEFSTLSFLYDKGKNLKGKLKGIVSDSNNIFLWHKAEDINKKGYFQHFSWFQFYVYKLCMITCIDIAP